jgi:hypothetical protein
MQPFTKTAKNAADLLRPAVLQLRDVPGGAAEEDQQVGL